MREGAGGAALAPKRPTFFPTATHAAVPATHSRPAESSILQGPRALFGVSELSHLQLRGGAVARAAARTCVAAATAPYAEWMGGHVPDPSPERRRGTRRGEGGRPAPAPAPRPALSGDLAAWWPRSTPPRASSSPVCRWKDPPSPWDSEPSDAPKIRPAAATPDGTTDEDAPHAHAPTASPSAAGATVATPSAATSAGLVGSPAESGHGASSGSAAGGFDAAAPLVRGTFCRRRVQLRGGFACWRGRCARPRGPGARPSAT